MSDQEKDKQEETLPADDVIFEEESPETEEKAEQGEETEQTEQEVLDLAAAAVREQEDKYLRLLAEYDNFRKRSIKEREAVWATAKSDVVTAILPIYDNLERALKQETQDEAYAKGVQMTMTQLQGVLEKLGIEEIPAQGQTFDPELHNAVMHVEDEGREPNTVVEVFQAGFRLGGKVLRHALVKVAN